MKKYIIITLALLAGLAFGADQYQWEGYGTNVTATTTAQVISIPNTNYVYSVSLDNQGAGKVRWKIKYGSTGTTNDFVLTSAMPLLSGMNYTDPTAIILEKRNMRIYEIIIVTESGTAVVDVTFK